MTADTAPARDRYTTIAIALHWLIALAIIAMLAMGLIMTGMDHGMMQFKLFQLHKSIGITILAFSLVRLGWRLTHRPPPLPAGMSRGEVAAARATHIAFYILMIGMPLTGWAMASTSPMNLPTVLYGVITLPHLPGVDRLPDKAAASSLFGTMHSYAAWTMIALLALHVGAALMHQFVRRDAVLHRMLPLVRNRKALP